MSRRDVMRLVGLKVLNPDWMEMCAAQRHQSAHVQGRASPIKVMDAQLLLDGSVDSVT